MKTKEYYKQYRKEHTKRLREIEKEYRDTHPNKLMAKHLRILRKLFLTGDKNEKAWKRSNALFMYYRKLQIKGEY